MPFHYAHFYYVVRLYEDAKHLDAIPEREQLYEYCQEVAYSISIQKSSGFVKVFLLLALHSHPCFVLNIGDHQRSPNYNTMYMLSDMRPVVRCL